MGNQAKIILDKINENKFAKFRVIGWAHDYLLSAANHIENEINFFMLQKTEIRAHSNQQAFLSW